MAGVFGLSVAIAYGLPTTYQSTAKIEVATSGGGGVRSGSALSSDATAFLADRKGMEKLLREPSLASSSRTVPLDALPASATVHAESERLLSISFDASSPELARDGCTAVSDLLVAHFGKDSKSAARAELERATKALADFVNAHPDVLPEEPAPSATASSSAPPAPRNDSALTVLKDEKLRLEAELAQRAATGSSKENPYDDDGPNVDDLQKQLARVKYAISVRLKTVAAPSGSAGPSKGSGDPAQQARWRELVRALVDAEHPPESAGPVGSSAHIIVAPSFPELPIRPNRLLWMSIGGLVALWLSLLNAVFRFVRADRLDDPNQTGDFGVAFGEPHLALLQLAASGASRRVDASDPLPQGPATPRVPVLERSVSGGSGTRIGMMDPALVRTRFGGTPADMLARPTGAAPATVEPLPTTEPQRPTGVPGAAEPRPDDPPRTLKGHPTSDAPAVRKSEAPAGASARPSTPAGGTLAPGGGPVPAGATPDVAVANGPALGSTQKASTDVIDPKWNAPVARRPSSDPPAPASVRPSRIPMPQNHPAASRASDVFSPPDARWKRSPRAGEFAPAPDTQRMGTARDPAAMLPKTISPPPPPPSVPPRVDTSGTRYSFVDRTRASKPPPQTEVVPASTRPPAATREAVRGRPAPAGTLVDLRELAKDPAPEAHRPSSRPPAAVQEVPKPTFNKSSEWSSPSSTPEVWEKVAASKPQEPLVVKRPVSASWRLQPLLTSESNVLGGLRDKIFDFTAHAPFVLAVTSERQSVDQKSIMATRLSAMLSDDGRAKVLLVEANFDYPHVHRMLSIEMPPGEGFSQQLRARTRGQRKPWTVVRCTDAFDVLAEGMVRSPGILLSQEFANAIAELRRCYDVIVIDGPPTGERSDKPINAVSDGIAIVTPAAHALRESIERGMSLFGQKKLLVALPANGG